MLEAWTMKLAVVMAKIACLSFRRGGTPVQSRTSLALKTLGWAVSFPIFLVDGYCN
jgi:hypothetical protein